MGSGLNPLSFHSAACLIGIPKMDYDNPQYSKYVYIYVCVCIYIYIYINTS
jgi:hypothetical protein